MFTESGRERFSWPDSRSSMVGMTFGQSVRRPHVDRMIGLAEVILAENEPPLFWLRATVWDDERGVHDYTRLAQAVPLQLAHLFFKRCGFAFDCFEARWLAADLPPQRESPFGGRNVIRPAVDEDAVAEGDATGEQSNVYFVQSVPYPIHGELPPAGPIKIGCTNNLTRRLTGLQSGNASHLVILANYPGGVAEEAALHERFAAHRLRGEWFAPADELLDHILEVSSVCVSH